MSYTKIHLFLLLTLFALAQALPAQTGVVPFDLQVQQAVGVVHIADGGNIPFSTDGIGVPSAPVSLTVTYTGTLGATFSAIQITGSSDFAVSGLPNVPLSLGNPQNFVISIRYTPSTGKAASGQILFQYTEGKNTNKITVNLSGSAPDFVFSYIPLPDGNTTIVSSGGSISFPSTLLGSTSTATFAITNQGSGPGTVASIAVAGTGFSSSGLPLPNASVSAGGDLRFTVRFTPTQLGDAQGSVKVQLTQKSFTFTLAGTGVSPIYSYSLTQVSGASPLVAGQTVTFPDTSVGQQNSMLLQIRNTGNANGSITDIAVLGTGFQLSNLPFLPATVVPGGSISFNLVFAPTQAGAASGRLRIGGDNFNLAGTGLGSAISYSYLVGGAPTAVQGGGAVILSPAAVGATGSTTFSIANTGTLPGNISSIGVEGSGGVFSLPDLPPLPLTITPGQTVSFSIIFTPNNLGLASASLRIDTQVFTLSGSGTAAVPLPRYTFDGVAATVSPMTQLAAGLTLASPYPLPLSGTVVLSFDSGAAPDDPAVQFAAGGRSINFTIPANTTRAFFPNNAVQARLQTGSVSGTITLTPSFATAAGLALTPSAPAPLRTTVPASAPQLLTAQLVSKGTNTFTVSLNGLATGRNLTQITFQIDPVAGLSLSIPATALDVQNAFSSWYQSAASQPFGSQFSATVPFTVDGQVQGMTNLVDSLQTVTISLTNQQGRSNAIAIPLR